MNAEEVFRRLKPLCVQVAQQPTIRNLTNLKDGLQSVERSILNERSMVEYVIFPLKLTIQRIDSKNEKLLIKTLECMSFVFESVSVKAELLFMEIFDICSVLLSSMKQPNGKDMIATLSEEVKLSITHCLANLLQNSPKCVFLCLYNKKGLPRLGHAISLLLALLEYEVERNLRIKALDCLGYLTLRNTEVGKVNHQLISDVFCSFIPGISLTFSRVLTEQVNIGQNLAVAVTNAFRDFIVLVMSDSKFGFERNTQVKVFLSRRLREIQQNQPLETSTPKYTNERQQKEIMIVRNDAWMKETSSKLQILIEKVTSRLASNSSYRVRQAAVSFAEAIIVTCSMSMKKSTLTLLETLAGLQNDEHQEVSSKVNEAIRNVQSVIDKDGWSLFAFIEEKLYERLLALPRIMRGADDGQKLMFLNVIVGYFMLIENQISKLLSSMVMLEKIIRSFAQVLELDTSDVRIVEEKNLISSEEMVSDKLSGESKHTDFITHRFKNFKDPKVYFLIRKICFTIGTFSDLQIIVDYLLEKFVTSSGLRKEFVLLLNEMLQSRYDSTRKSTCDSIIDQILATFLHEEYWYLPTTNISSADITEKDALDYQIGITKTEENRKDIMYWEKGIPFTIINSNIQLICLMLDGISNCSGVLKERFRVCLIKVLYPVLEKLGDQNAQISKCALKTLNIISHNVGEDSIAALLLNNADYLVNSVSMSFRHLTLFSSAPNVLSMMLVHSSKDILPVVADVIQELFNCLDYYQEDMAFSLLRVLRSFVSSVNLWFGIESDVEREEEQTNKMVYQDSLSPEGLKNFLENYCALKIEALGESDQDIDEEIASHGEGLSEDLCNETENNQDEKKKVPLHYQTTLTALETCQHFLGSKKIATKLLILDIIEISVQALKNQQNNLLPVLHKIWPAIVERVKDSNQVIVSRTLEVICTTIECSGDFLRRRVKKEILPFATEYLKKEASSGLKRSQGYKFSSPCKLQTKLLKLIGSIIQNLSLKDEDLIDVVSVCSKYLDCRQPETLQVEAVGTLKIAKHIDWDQTWLVLTSLYCPKELVPPCSQFEEILMDKTVYTRNEFTDNVTKILYNDH